MRVLSALFPAVVLLALGAGLSAQRGQTFTLSRDHPAIRYSTHTAGDRVASLNEKVQSGAAALAFDADSGYLRSILQALRVPVESQSLVFSQTSSQGPLINRGNPRALFFNDAVAVGWVRGAPQLELAAQDRDMGVIFYTLEQRRVEKPRFKRDDSCLECHQTPDTLGVPGLFVMSVFSVPAENDKYSYATGEAMDHRSPLADRWGGWYVTGHSPERHLGNIPIAPTAATVKRGSREMESVKGEFDTKGYPTAQSDIAALMVLEHQAHMVNLLTRTAWEGRVALAAPRPNPSPPPQARAGASTDPLKDAVRELVDYMLFVDEAPLAGPIRSSSNFAQVFAAEGPADSKGRSLRQLSFERRMMRYPCSYMIYSEAFDALPGPAKAAVYERLSDVLSGRETGTVYAKLSLADRRAIVEILRETKKGLPESFKVPAR
jgi:hypothetical protein